MSRVHPFEPTVPYTPHARCTRAHRTTHTSLPTGSQALPAHGRVGTGWLAQGRGWGWDKNCGRRAVDMKGGGQVVSIGCQRRRMVRIINFIIREVVVRNSISSIPTLSGHPLKWQIRYKGSGRLVPTQNLLRLTLCCVLGAPAGGPPEFDTAPASHKVHWVCRHNS